MEESRSFGTWLRQQRKAGDLTQDVLAAQVGCSPDMIRKIELGRARPSRQLAELLATQLAVPAAERAAVVGWARRPLAAAAALPAAARAAAHVSQLQISPTALKTHLPLRHNLPTQLTSFIGREREIQDVKQLLAQTRLLTLGGPGGTGKTRLALRVAADLLDGDHFPQGIWLVELAPLADPALVPHAVAAALGVRETAGRSTFESLKGYLHRKQLLLVLDNCEHLVDACAQLADALLRVCPTLQILASSREALGIGGETTWRVPSLSMPDPALLAGSNLVPVLRQYEAVRLFSDRAQAALPSFQLTEQNAPAVAQICHRLDGIPLAIELAATRVRALSVEQIAGRLDDRFRLLTGGSRAALPRQQTLRATMDWSYRLLSAPERVLLRRLTVFAGDWTPEAAEVVCPGRGLEEDAVLDGLLRLVDKSLVTFEHGGEVRYRLLETIRQYGREKLLDAGEGETRGVRDRHLGYYLQFIEDAEPGLRALAEASWLDRVEREHDNLRVAMEWSLQRAGGETEASTVDRAAAGLRIAGVLARFWEERGHYTEGRRWLRQLLAAHAALGGGRTAAQAKALDREGRLASNQGDNLEAQPLHEASLEIFRELGDKLGMIAPLNMLGGVAHVAGNYDSARSFYEQALTLAREVGDTKRVAVGFHNLGYTALSQGKYAEAQARFEEGFRLASALGKAGATVSFIAGLGDVALEQGEYEQAKRLFEESLAQARALGQRGSVLILLRDLGRIAGLQGDPAHAQALYTDGLLEAQDLGLKTEVALRLGGLAELACARDEPERAAQLFGAFEAIGNLQGLPIFPAWRTTLAQCQAAVRAQLGVAAWTEAWEAGQSMTMDQAIRYAMNRPAQVGSGLQQPL